MSSLDANVSADEALQVQARKQSNLAFAFFCMEKDRARDMEVFYTYCRVLDDIADDVATSVEQKIASLNAWKNEVENIYSAKTDELSPLGIQLRDTVMRRDVPKKYLLDIIDGVLRDTDPVPFETFSDIKKYCYGVASAVGLASIYIFGFKNEKTKEFAESLGYALQFTNILRDVIYDWKEMKRVYIPSCEMSAFGVSSADFDSPVLSKNCKELFKMLYFRAKHFFNRARAQLAPEDAVSLTPAMIMWAIYERILEKIKECDFEISEKVIKISKPQKIALAFSAIRKAKKYSKPLAKNFGRAAVLGGGVAGVAAAIQLSKMGYEVDLYESKAHLGGRVSMIDWNQSGVFVDNSSHVVMDCYENFLSIIDDLGFDKNEVFERAERIEFIKQGGESFYCEFPKRGGFWNAFGGGIFKFPKIEGFKVKENLAMLAKVKFSLQDIVEGETVEDFLDKNNVGDVARNMLWEPFCLAVQNTSISEADAKMFAVSLQKSLLRGVGKSSLLVNKIPYAQMLERAKYFIEACGGSVKLSSSVEALEIEDGRVKSFSCAGEKFANFDFVGIALPRKKLVSLLEDCPLKKAASSISDSAILNIYFSTKTKLFDGRFVALAQSPLHWIFDKTPENFEDGHLYAITVSAFEGSMDVKTLADEIKRELEKYFGDFEYTSFKPSIFKDATIRSTAFCEKFRPKPSGHFENALIVGDWLNTELPCTMESASSCIPYSKI